jgi:eukaryotic-like serine/threonine-protein kinase
MEYVDGESLSAILSRGALDPRRAIDIARQIADGLSAAHELGIVHRDLKPDNVIVASSRAGKETPKVVDFGIAKALSDAPQDALTRSGLVIGTPEYMSPEQLLGDPVDARADIYSLGCILYQMLTGVQPFAAESREQMIRRRLHEAPPHVRDVLPEIPRRLDTLIVHMLARSPGDRLASAAVARDALDPGLALGGWDPSMVTAPRPTPETAHGWALRPDPSLQPTALIPRQRMSVKRIAAGAVAGSVLMLAALVYWSQRDVPTRVAPRHTDSLRVQSAGMIAPDTQPRKLPALSKTDSAAAAKPKPAPDPDLPVRAPLMGLAAAINSGNIQVVNEKYPQLPKTVAGFLGQLYNSYDGVRASTAFGSAHVTGDAAELPVVIHLRYRARGTGSMSSSDPRMTAKLVRKSDRWALVELVPQS